jgi:aminoglycoside 3-N-acetyltransferase
VPDWPAVAVEGRLGHASFPQTQDGLGRDLRRLGVVGGDTLLVNSSLRSLGWVIGGTTAVVGALLDAVGPDGTIVVPAGTANNADPSRWHLTCKHGVPEQWWPWIRDHLPAFDPARTPSVNMGAIAEAVRVWPGSIRSQHPQTSFAALGREARWLMADHALDCHLGEQSPLARLEKLSAKVLLLGVGYATCTAFHLAEYRVPGKRFRDYECVIDDGNGRRWYRYRDVALDDAPFADLGREFESSPEGARWLRRGQVGEAECRLFPLDGAVEFAVTWLTARPQTPRPRGVAADGCLLPPVLIGPDC